VEAISVHHTEHHQSGNHVHAILQPIWEPNSTNAELEGRVRLLREGEQKYVGIRSVLDETLLQEYRQDTLLDTTSVTTTHDFPKIL
jgi:hypothetical protein